MKFSLFIARRYFFSKKKKNFINVIAIISMVVVAVGTMSMIIALSVFNGLESLLQNVYGQFDPELTIRSKSKTFLSDPILEEIENYEIDGVVEVISDNVLAKFAQSQRVVILKGVSSEFMEHSGIQEAIVSGQFQLLVDEIPYALIGRGIQYDLSIHLNDAYNGLQLIYPKDINPGVIDPNQLFRFAYILPAGVFAIEKYYDENFIIVPIEVARNLLGKKEVVSSIELFIKNPKKIEVIRSSLQKKLGDDFEVLREEQLHQELFLVLKWEKLFVYLTLTSIIGIASINIFFTLTMLVIEKKKDISVLYGMGTHKQLIRNIFLLEGLIISMTGACVGLFLGLSLCYIQQYFGILKFGVSSSIMNSYPVNVEFFDVVMAVLTIFGISIISSISPSRKAAKIFSTTALQ